MQDTHIQHNANIPADYFGQRLDQVAAALFPEYSRSRLQQWIKTGALTVNGQTRRPRDKVIGGERLDLSAELEEQGSWIAENIPLDIVHQDDEILVINKPVGLVVHPGAGNPQGTLLNALLYAVPALVTLPRAGIVHRLDKDTSGLMVVAKTLRAQHSLVEQLQARTVHREYQAVVQGVLVGGGTVDAPIGRHPRVRTRMAVVAHSGKQAITHYRVLKRFDNHTHIRVQLETGRTHQIRVHMAHLDYPLIGDAVYGGRLKLPKGASEDLRGVLRNFKRQALHAVALSFDHPASGQSVRWQVPLANDMVELLAALEVG